MNRSMATQALMLGFGIAIAFAGTVANSSSAAADPLPRWSMVCTDAENRRCHLQARAYLRVRGKPVPLNAKWTIVNTALGLKAKFDTDLGDDLGVGLMAVFTPGDERVLARCAAPSCTLPGGGIADQLLSGDGLIVHISDKGGRRRANVKVDAAGFDVAHRQLVEEIKRGANRN